jgi:hypothetical protein
MKFLNDFLTGSEQAIDNMQQALDEIAEEWRQAGFESDRVLSGLFRFTLFFLFLSLLLDVLVAWSNH